MRPTAIAQSRAEGTTARKSRTANLPSAARIEQRKARRSNSRPRSFRIKKRSSIDFPDEPVEQRRYCGEIHGKAGNPKVDVDRQNNEINDNEKAIDCEQHEAGCGPQQQCRSQTHITAHEKRAASGAGCKTEDVD